MAELTDDGGFLLFAMEQQGSLLGLGALEYETDDALGEGWKGIPLKEIEHSAFILLILAPNGFVVDYQLITGEDVEHKLGQDLATVMVKARQDNKILNDPREPALEQQSCWE